MDRIDIAIVGAGPVGLTLACLLARRGFDVRVIEARSSPAEHSRAIGIHPPALDVFDSLGVGERMRSEGTAIGGGRVFLDGRASGRLSLPDAPLSLPQSSTEAILDLKLHKLAPNALLRSYTVEKIQQGDNAVDVFGAGFEPLRATLLVGCDGAGGNIRELAGIGRSGGPLPDRYLMGDFADDTEFGSDAALFFGRGGIVESFPLPENRRRWVARLSNLDPTEDVRGLASLVFERTSRQLPVESCSWISPFRIQTYLATSFLRGNVAVVGDAAHVVSPIGGQGMNLGILGAATLARSWDGSLDSLSLPLAAHRRLAKSVSFRARFNTAMGRPIAPLSPKRILIRSVLSSHRLARRFASAFTMRDLPIA